MLSSHGRQVPGNFHIGTHGSMAPSYLSFWDERAPPRSGHLPLEFPSQDFGESGRRPWNSTLVPTRYKHI